MNAVARFWDSTIGKKVVMAVTGIIGVLFVIGHMAGNLTMFKGQQAMHDYANLLRISTPLLWAIRLGLLTAVVLHVTAAYQLTMRSRAARPADYAKREPQVSTLSSRTIRVGGVVLLVFIVYHLLDLTIGALNPGFVHLDPYRNLVAGLSNPLVAALYIAAVLALAMHLHHGVWSMVRTLGLARATPNPLHRRLSIAVAAIVAAGFLTIPLGVLGGVFEPVAPLPGLEAGHDAPAVTSR